MSSIPPSLPPIPSGAPAIPLTDEVRAAYQDLYDQYEGAIEATEDPSLEASLLASQTNVDNVLTKDTMYKLHANSALFDALLKQISDTNDELVTLKTQITAIASKISTAATIISAIDKVLTLTGAV